MTDFMQFKNRINHNCISEVKCYSLTSCRNQSLKAHLKTYKHVLMNNKKLMTQKSSSEQSTNIRSRNTEVKWSYQEYHVGELNRLQYHQFYATVSKAVIDHRLCPHCCHLGSYFKSPKSNPMRPLACNWHYCTQLIAKPKAACALYLSGDVEEPWLMNKHGGIHKTGSM